MLLEVAMRLSLIMAVTQELYYVRVDVFSSTKMLSMGLILWQLIYRILISHHRALRSIVPYGALNLDQHMRVIRLLFSNLYTDFPVQERTSNTVFVVV